MKFHDTFYYQDKSDTIHQFTTSAEKLLSGNSNHFSHIMIVFSINNFNHILTNHGFAQCNKLVGYVKRVLHSYIHEPNLYCHYQAGSFAIFLENYKNIDLALLVIQLTEEITGYDKNYNLKLSFGICKAGPCEFNIQFLYNRAMYAKSSVKADAYKLLADYSELAPV